VNSTNRSPKEILGTFKESTFLCKFRSWEHIPIYNAGSGTITAVLDRLRAFCHNQHSQYGCCIANASRNRQECFR
jgi:hypothetical protein